MSSGMNAKLSELNSNLSNLGPSLEATQDKLRKLVTTGPTRARDDHGSDGDEPDTDTVQHSRFGWLLI